MHTYKNKQEMKKCINKKMKIRKRDRTKQKISVKVSEGKQGKSIKVKKIYITELSMVGGHVPPQSSTGHMASTDQRL